jgi:hypothetical protein
MIRRLVTLSMLCGLAVSLSACDKCGDWLKPKGPFGLAVCKTGDAR